MARAVAICNQKGGVGKSTTAVNVGAYLAVEGHATLIVDLDAQGNATARFVAPPALDPALVGLALHHAYGVLDPSLTGVVFVSEASTLLLLP